MDEFDKSSASTANGSSRYAPALVLAVSLLLTGLLWLNAHNASVQELRMEFDFQARETGERLYRRIGDYQQVLYGVRAFYLNQHEMERREFAGYVAALELQRHFPGMQGISYSMLVPDANKSAHISAMQRSGLPDYAIVPEGKRPAYAPVAYIEPMDARNERVLGFDNLSNAARKATIERARDEGRCLISEKLSLLQEDAKSPQSGFLMFLPVFRAGAAHDTLAGRRAHIDGWFAAAFRMNDLMSSVLHESPKGLSIAVFDEGGVSEQTRMFGSPLHAVAQFSTDMPLEIAGRKWTLQLASLPEFEAQRDMQDERIILLAGVLLSLLLSLITWLLLRDRQRALQSAAAVARELAKRQQAEHITEDLHKFNKAILERSPFGIALYRHSGPCIMANEAFARALGGTVEEVVKHDFRNNAAWQRNGLLDYANQAFESGLTIRRDIEGETTFGRRVMHECIFAVIDIAAQPHLLLIVHDISERAKTERALTESMRQLEEKELAKTRFLAAAGHDLRQPVAAANLFIDALKLAEPNPRQSAIIQRLDQSMATFNGLLDSLLNVSKLDAGMINPEYTSINVAELFNWLDQNFAPMAHEKKLGFRLYFPMRKMLRVRSDIGLIKSILMNLVSNAVKFTARGAILVSARQRGDNVLFQVWDTGMGIPEEHRARIFDEFYQINNPQRDRSGGLGLGLSIAKRALTLMGGDIRCHSRLGHGSVFEFTLPLAGGEQAAPLAGQPAEDDIAHETFARGKRFVVVEDDALVAQGMINWLEGMGAEVKCFPNAEDALRHPSIEHADFYIADYMLGGNLNGIQFLNLLRQKIGRPIKAVLVTGDTSAAFIRHAVDCDWPVQHKPINTSRLISHLLAQQPQV